MDKRKIGVTILVFALLFGGVILNFIGNTQETGSTEGCFENAECNAVATTLSISHLGIGLLFALGALGLYLIVFGRNEELLLKQLDQKKEYLTREEKLKVVTMMLSTNEQKVLQEISENEGITQNVLRLKTDLSKAMISQILSGFEKKNLIMREIKGKTYAIFLKNTF